jgi:hypothetical protein
MNSEKSDGEGPVSTAVNWDSLSRCYRVWGIIFLSVAVALIVLFFVWTNAGLVMPFTYFEKYTLAAMILSIALSFVSGMAIFYFSFFVGNKYGKNCFSITLPVSIINVVINIALLVWLIVQNFNPYSLTNLIISLFEAIAGFAVSFDMYCVQCCPLRYRLYVVEDETNKFLRWNDGDDIMEYDQPKLPVEIREEARHVPAPEPRKEPYSPRESIRIHNVDFNQYFSHIKRTVKSNQLQDAAKYRIEKEDVEGYYRWTNTHFMFAIDGSCIDILKKII